MGRTYSTPGVYREEIDISDILVPTGISNGGIVIRSTKGPINRAVLVQNDKDFIETFGNPYFNSGCSASVDTVTDAKNYKLIPEYGYGSYAALEFLKESQTLYVVRGFSTGDSFANADIYHNLNVSSYATSSFSAISISADDTQGPDRIDKIYSIDQASFTRALGVAALYPGKDGDKIAVTIEAAWSACDWINSYDTYTSAVTAITTDRPIASKVFKLNVYKMDDKISSWSSYIDASLGASLSGLRISPVETFYGTLTPQIDGNNNQLFIESLVNGKSKNIYVKAGSTLSFTNLSDDGSNRPVSADSVGSFVYANKLIKLAGGYYKTDSGIGNSTGWDLFADREYVNVGILMVPDWTSTVKNKIATIVASRLDCIASVQTGDFTINDVDSITDSYGYSEPSYVALYAGWSKIYDNYNQKFVYIPNSVYGATLMARVDNVAAPWSAPAGIDRGTLSVFDQNKVFNFADIGNLYDRNINSVRFIRGTGYVMWGQKTAQMKKSAADRINVRRLLLYIENNVETALLPFVFENNTDKTRLRVFSLVDEFMSGVKAGGGVTDYDVVCDGTNNTPTVIDSNQLAVDLYVQPVRTVEFIVFRTIVTRTGISFSAVRQ